MTAPSGHVLGGHQPKPGRTMAPSFEGAQVVDRGDEGGGGQRPHASDSSEPLTHRGVHGELRDARIVPCAFGILRYRPVATHPRGAPDRGRSVHCPHLPQSTGSPAVCGQYLEARQELLARHLLVQHDVPLGVDTMELEYLFSRINPQCANLAHGGPSCERGDDSCYPHHDRHPPGCIAGWVHTIRLGRVDEFIIPE